MLCPLVSSRLDSVIGADRFLLYKTNDKIPDTCKGKKTNLEREEDKSQIHWSRDQ